MSSKVPPHNLEAEQSILGSLMLEPNSWEAAGSVIISDDFYVPANRRIFAVMQDLALRNRPIDIISVSNLLQEKQELDGLGGHAYLAHIVHSTPTAAHLESWVEIVRSKALLRRLIRVSTETIEKASSETIESTEKFLDEVEGEIFKLSDRTRSSGLVGSAELVRSSIDRLMALSERGADFIGIPTGFHKFDKLTAGLQGGDLIIVAARPSMGKTAFSLNLAQHVSLRENKSVAFFSLEMGKEQLMTRMLASEAKVNLTDLRIGNVGETAWPKLIEKASKIADARLFIDDTSGISPLEIRAKCRRLKAQHGLDLIMIDYLQMMTLKQKTDNRQHEVAEMSRMLKTMAKELNVPVVALAQLSRAVESRSDRRPMLSDLRESGSIEQDADIVMMLYREDYYDRENPEVKGISELIIAKHRNGPTDTVRLRFEGQYSRFSNLEEGVGDHPLPPPPPNPQANHLRRVPTQRAGNA
jgi:replicative DNA helicase